MEQLYTGEESLVDEVLRDPSAYGERIRRQADEAAAKWVDQQISRRLEAERADRARTLGRRMFNLIKGKCSDHATQH